ncbi:MAG: hypothetical protein Q8Q23_02490 [bacterium]|nr:hypothetical protein [bacterium]
MASSQETFLQDYLEIVQSDEVGTVAQWTLRNAAYMREGMFFNSRIDWNKLSPAHILALRACAPNGVFTDTAKVGFLNKIAESDSELYLSGLVDALFGTSDLKFLDKLPPEYSRLKPQLIQLMQLAYRYKIRPADVRVKQM